MTRAANATLRASAASGVADGVVRVTAIVTYRRGQLIAGLKPGDFELLVDGKPQAVDAVEVFSDNTAPRAFGILLDEFHTAPSDSAAVRERLLQFVDRQLRPGDTAFAVKPLDSLLTLQPTTDRTALRQAIATFAGRKGDYAPRTPFERDYMAQAPTAVAGARGQIVTSALRAIGLALAQARNARSAIVLVSDGFERMRTGRDVPANLQTAIRVANRADAPVYAFAPAPPPAAADGAETPDPAFTALRTLTAQTGGELIAGAGEFVTGLERMARDLDRHYVLTYRAPHGSDGRFHALQVAVRRDGAQVRARSGYVAPMSAAMRAAANPPPSAPLRVLRRSALIQSWSGVLPVAPDRVNVVLTWEPSLARPGGAGGSRASTVVITASTPGGDVLFDAAVAPAGEPASDGVPNRAMFDAPAGPIRVDMKILDARGVVIDTDARDVTVPTSRKDSPIIYPPSVTRARSAREFRDALEQETIPPIATRDFRRTDRLLVRVPAFGADGSPVAVSGVLLNRWRQPMREVPPLETRTAPRGITQFDLPLAVLAPGEYTLRLTVTHAAGSVSEHVTFRVAG